MSWEINFQAWAYILQLQTIKNQQAEMKVILAFLSLLALSRAVVYFCSTYCLPTSCSGWTRNSCTNCNSLLGWVAAGSTCALGATSGRQIGGVSDDLLGVVSVLPSGGSAECTNLPLGASIVTYGSYKSSQSISVMLAGGTSVPHYAVELFYSVVTIDTDGTRPWGSGTKITTSLDLTTPAQAPTFTLNPSTAAATEPTYCGDITKKDRLYQVQHTYAHNALGVDISFTITTDNADSLASWVAREFIYVLKICHSYCQICTGPAATECSACNSIGPYMLSATTCAASCAAGYGQTVDPTVCILCDTLCSACYNTTNNCSSCKSTPATLASYLYYNSSLGYSTCLSACPTLTFINITLRTCDPCSGSCTQCSQTATHCQACATGYGWYNHTCYMPCPVGFFSDLGGLNCTLCNATCIDCTSIAVCLFCTLNGTNIAYFLNSSCLTNCPVGYYPNNNNLLGPNVCSPCFNTCATCTGNPTPCQSCINGSYLYNNTCGATCPVDWFASSIYNLCLQCSTTCVRLSINMYFSSAINEEIYIDMTFTRALNPLTFDCTNFQTVQVSNYPLSAFNITYQWLNNNTYRIKMKPVGYVFLYNETVTVKTMTMPGTPHNSQDLIPFHNSTYSQISTLSWFLMRVPEMTDFEKKIIDNFAQISNTLITATTHPLIAQFKKSGLLAMLFSGAQITSCSVLINNVPPQNMYQGVRIWAAFIFWDVPAWQQKSELRNKVVIPDVYDLVRSQRRLIPSISRQLFDMTTIPWRFHRTGQSSFFLYDVYMPIALIIGSWLALAISRCFALRTRKRIEPKCWTILHKVHQAAVLYITMGMVLEWMYFDGASMMRWISLGVSIFICLYLTFYHLYIYYDLLKYPKATIGTQLFDYYVYHYSCYLGGMRFQEFNLYEKWSPWHWFRPYNYHIIGFYKKFCMMISLPLFYNSKHAQASILIFLQLLQVIRFIITKPYYQRWRHCCRLLLELILLLFFATLLAQGFILQQIKKNDPSTINQTVQVFSIIGWVACILVFIFNCSWLIIGFVGIVRNLRMTSLEQVEQGRRVFYYDTLVTYQKEHENAPLGLLNHWVKSGNLNRRNKGELPDINLRIEDYRIQRKYGYYLVTINVTTRLVMNEDLNFDAENNTTALNQIRKIVKLTPELSVHLHSTAVQLYSRHAKMETEAITLKTFLLIKQKDFTSGDEVPLDRKRMFQRLQLENIVGQISKVDLPKMIQGFPLNRHELMLL